MPNEDGTVWVVFNGEIYNFAELRKELVHRGHRFRSDSDTEVIVHLYEEHGDESVDRLEGMFALGIWDVRRRRLLLARDRAGEKPLKYADLGHAFVFASELKALLATGLVEREVDPGQLHAFFTFGYVPAPGTGFRRIHKLPPAHRLVWEDGRVRLERYWELDYRAKRTLTPQDWSESVRGAVRRAVTDRMMSDVPLGAFLSGGVDSGIVVACMAEASSRPVETFSIGFEHEAYDELPLARRVAERYRTAHHEFVVRADDASLLPALARLYEEPYADSSALPTYFLARETRRHVTVALSGDGGDEAFAGYARYRRLDRARSGWLRAPGVRASLALASRAGAWLPPHLARRIEVAHGLGDPDLGAGYAWTVRLFSDREKRWLYGDALRHTLERPGSALLSAWMNHPRAGETLIDRMCFTDVMGYLPDDLLVKVDLACMIHGLEARAPFLDHRVLELAASMPAETRFPGGRLKGLLKHAFRDVLPALHLAQPKRGFAIPVQEWFRGPLLPLAREALLAPGARVHAYLRREALAEALDHHAAGRIRLGFQLWALLMLELWHREVVDRPPRSW
jgi:asparagine synthase (glutamine-hydrolysing)